MGSFEGMKLFIPYTIPGERVTFRIVQSRKRYAWAELEEVIDPSPGRRQPPCPYFGRCGGCQWQHMLDSTQIFWKERIFRDVLTRMGNVEESRIKHLTPSPLALGYRHRINLKVRNGKMGFLSGKSHMLEEIKKCLLACSNIQEAMGKIRKKFYGLPSGDLELVVSPDEPGVMLSARFNTRLRQKRRKKLKGIVSEVSQLNSLYVSSPGEEWEKSFTASPSGEAGLGFKLDLSAQSCYSPLNLTFFPGVFIQVNWKQNIKLIENLLTTVNGLGKQLRILKLYAGAGNFTVPLAAAGHTLVTVEQGARAVTNARFNLAKNNLGGVQLLQQSAEHALLEIEARRQNFHVLVADPPRAGLKQEISTLIRLKIPYLIYISCDPATLSRDLRILIGAGYEVEYVQPLDFFPQTYHVESITFLRLAKFTP